MGPAGPAVLRNVLVAGGAGIVDAVNVAPVPALGELSSVQVLVGPWVGSAQKGKNWSCWFFPPDLSGKNPNPTKTLHDLSPSILAGAHVTAAS